MKLYLTNLWDLYVDMSFYIVIGLIFTGILHSFVKKDAILKYLGKNTSGSVIKASVLGVPLPLCSCGVVPTAMYLGKSGASKGAVVSFLTSTPQTGVDSLIATYGMLGPLFAVYRAVSAFISGIISGIATNLLCRNDKISYNKISSGCSCSHNDEEDHCEDDCCCQSNDNDHCEDDCCCQSNDNNHCEDDCCSNNNSPAKNGTKKFLLYKIKDAFAFAFGDFLDEISFHFIIGLLIAALISTLLPADILSNLNNPLLNMLLMIVIGIPMYICSTASIPIAVSLMIKGISPGAAFVFLFAGPVTNIASLSILIKTLGKKVTAIYLSSVAVCAIAFGLLFDFIIDVSDLSVSSKITEQASEHDMPVYMIIVAVLFGILVIRSLIKHFSSNKKCSCQEA